MSRLDTLDLRAEGIAEAHRLARSRGWARSGDEHALTCLGVERPLVARTRRPATRKALNGRLLLVFQVAARSATDRAIDTELMAVLVKSPAPAGPRPRDRVRRAVHEAEAAARPVVEAAAARWLESVRTNASMFAAARVGRAAVAGARAFGASPASYQPGLFDRRADRAHEVSAAAARERGELTRTRLDAARAETVAGHTVELILVLAT